jgi:hypothetical protein
MPQRETFKLGEKRSAQKWESQWISSILVHPWYTATRQTVVAHWVLDRLSLRVFEGVIRPGNTLLHTQASTDQLRALATSRIDSRFYQVRISAISPFLRSK